VSYDGTGSDQPTGPPVVKHAFGRKLAHAESYRHSQLPKLVDSSAWQSFLFVLKRRGQGLCQLLPAFLLAL
jgi:hypothetical protein